MYKTSKLQTFLEKHKFNKADNPDKKPTHTRIPDHSKNIPGGSWYIKGDSLKQFHKLYHNHVVKNKNTEYLTELQHDDINQKGPLLLDFDFRYHPSVEKRQHNDDHIINIIGLYLEHLQKYFDLKIEEKSFPIFVFEKPTIFRVHHPEPIVKDGIHILIGIQMDHTLQCALREDILRDIPIYLDNLPITNSWSDVLDLKVTSGGTNWQIYGSQKPGNLKYELTSYYNTVFKRGCSDIELLKEEHIGYDKKLEHFEKLGAQYCDHPVYEETEHASNKRESYESRNRRRSTTNNNGATHQRNVIIVNTNDEIYELQDIKSVKQLVDTNQRFMNSLDDSYGPEHNILETYKYSMILPESYSHDYTKWIECGWALRNTDDRCFLTWMEFSTKSSKFSCYDILHYHEMWKKFDTGPRCLSSKTISFWARSYWKEKCRRNPDDTSSPHYIINEYEELQRTSIDYYIQKAIDSRGSDYDLGMVLYYRYKHDYINTNFDSRAGWYEFNSHYWVHMNSSSELLLTLSTKIYDLFSKQMISNVDGAAIVADFQEYEKDPVKNKNLMILSDIAGRLKNSTSKDHICKEAKSLFYDKNFSSKENENDYLLCFKNGVFDIRNGIFRDGYPEDYITKCTHIDYIPHDLLESDKYKSHKHDIIRFMEQLYPIPELNKFVWEVLASCTIAGNMNQKFYMFVGKGSNGKSLLISLLRKTFGEYFGDLPEQYLTQKRQNIGGASPEVMRLKGTRIAVVNEPSAGARINDGVMKEFTGGTDYITARKLYGDAESFIPKCKPIVCANNLYDIQTNDNGTWRRIDKVDHVSTFKDKADTNVKNEFEKDVNLERDKIKSGLWPPILMSMLLQLAVKTQGKVQECDIVKVASSTYRQDQDPILQFMNERISEDGDGRVKKSELQREFNEWYKTNFQGRPPKRTEIFERFDARFGASNKNGWKNIKLIYDDDSDEDI